MRFSSSCKRRTCLPNIFSLNISPTPWQEAWESLEKIYSEGAVRAIGVSNFPEQLLRELLGIARVVPAVVQNWMDPFHQDRAVRSLCAEKGEFYGDGCHHLPAVHSLIVRVFFIPIL